MSVFYAMKKEALPSVDLGAVRRILSEIEESNVQDRYRLVQKLVAPLLGTVAVFDRLPVAGAQFHPARFLRIGLDDMEENIVFFFEYLGDVLTQTELHKVWIRQNNEVKGNKQVRPTGSVYHDVALVVDLNTIMKLNDVVPKGARKLTKMGVSMMYLQLRPPVHTDEKMDITQRSFPRARVRSISESPTAGPVSRKRKVSSPMPPRAPPPSLESLSDLSLQPDGKPDGIFNDSSLPSSLSPLVNPFASPPRSISPPSSELVDVNEYIFSILELPPPALSVVQCDNQQQVLDLYGLSMSSEQLSTLQNLVQRASMLNPICCDMVHILSGRRVNIAEHADVATAFQTLVGELDIKPALTSS